MNRPFHGLPQEVKFCNQCVISNQRPNSSVEFKHVPSESKETIEFGENGVCSACEFNNSKNHKLLFLIFTNAYKSRLNRLTHKTVDNSGDISK